MSTSWGALSSPVPHASPWGDGTMVPGSDQVAGPCAELSLEARRQIFLVGYYSSPWAVLCVSAI